MSDKVLLFYNPMAGNGIFSSNLDRVISAFQKKDKLLLPVRAGGKSSILENLLAKGAYKDFSEIIAAGGDGTINFLVSAMMRHNVDLPLAIFPAGTANDLSYYFDISTNIEDMLQVATGTHRTKMDVGVVGDKYFVNVLAMGMMVDVSQKTDPAAKTTLGVMAYYLRSVAELPRIRPIPIRIKCPEFTQDLKIHAMLVMNGRAAGGFKRLAPEAMINDGLFDVFLFKVMPITNWAPLLMNLILGQHTENKYVKHFKTSKLRIESDEILNTDVDGEPGGPLPLDVKILPSRLTVCTREDDMPGISW